MKKLILAVAMALGLSFGVVVASDAAPVSAGSSCYAPVYLGRDGNYVTWAANGGGNGYHRVAVYRLGFWYYGPWKYGSGYSYKTVYSPPGTSTGSAICQVQ